MDAKTKKDKISKGDKESASMAVEDEKDSKFPIGEAAAEAEYSVAIAAEDVDADQGENEELDGADGSDYEIVGGGDDAEEIEEIEETAPKEAVEEESTPEEEVEGEGESSTPEEEVEGEGESGAKQAKTSKDSPSEAPSIGNRGPTGEENPTQTYPDGAEQTEVESETTSGSTQEDTPEDVSAGTEEAKTDESETTGGGSGRTSGLIEENTSTGSEESRRQGPLQLDPFEIVYNFEYLEVVPLAEHYGETVAVTVEFIEQYMRDVYDDAVEYVSAVVTAKKFVNRKPRLGFAVTILFVERVGYMFPHDVLSKLHEAFELPYMPYYVNMLNMLPVENEFQRTKNVTFIRSDTTLPQQAYHFTNQVIVPSHPVQERESQPQGTGLSGTTILAIGVVSMGLLFLVTRRRATNGPVLVV